jgi:hypothetical protein
MKRVGVLGLGLAFLLLSSNCAKEQSKEERTREQVLRKLARLSKAAGDYRGFLSHADNMIVPVDLVITVLSNPTNGDDDPMLQGSLRIGLFGGVQVASSAGSFDWGDGRVSFTFDRGITGGSSKALELRAYYKDGALTEAVLDAPRQGRFPLDLKRDASAQFSSDQEFNFGWRTPGATANLSPDPDASTTAPDALLRVNLRDQSFPAPGNLDLPYVPGLNATVLFNPLGQSPETATTVIYDPIGGTMDLYFTAVSLLHFDNLFLDPTSSDLTPNLLEGYIALGSVVQLSHLQAKRVPSSASVVINSIPSNPFKRYRGIYVGLGPEDRAEVYIKYMGSQTKNTDNFPFPNLPTIQLEMVICVGTEAHRRRVLSLVSIDHLNGIANFRYQNSPNEKDLELKYSTNWDSMDGNFLQGDGLGTVPPRLSITPSTFTGDECFDEN